MQNLSSRRCPNHDSRTTRTMTSDAQLFLAMTAKTLPARPNDAVQATPSRDSRTMTRSASRPFQSATDLDSFDRTAATHMAFGSRPTSTNHDSHALPLPAGTGLDWPRRPYGRLDKPLIAPTNDTGFSLDSHPMTYFTRTGHFAVP